jgi:TetR/AcrR family transcriptional regulator, transcriptional repressor for nem operon
MRYDNEHKQRTRQKLLEEASAAIRQHGPDNISVAALMAKVGLTHGGFYAHFKSKDELVAEAITYVLEERIEAFEKSLVGTDLSLALTHYIDLYLSPEHRDMRDKGCAVVALNGDVARMSADTKARFESGVQRTLSILSNMLNQLHKENPDALACSMLTEMVGALAVSRTLSNSMTSAWVLDNARLSVKKKMGLED